MAIRINTEDNEIIVSDVATEETLKELLKAVEDAAGQKGTPKKDPEVKKTQDAIKDLSKSNKDLTIKMTDWTGNFDDTMDDMASGFKDRSKMIATGLGKIVKNTGNIISDLIRGPASFESFGRAIQAGAGAVGDGLGSMVDSFQVLGTKIPGVGAGLSMLGAAAGAAAMAIAAYAQNMYDGFIALSQSGANYNGDIVRTAGAIQGLGLTMNAFTQIVQQNAEGLANFGGTVSLGAKRFVELTDVMHGQFGGQLYTLGLSFDEQAEQMAKFTQTQARNTIFQNMSYAQQSVLFKDYIQDLTKLTGLTGKSRQQLSEEIAQGDLRADANLRLNGATVEAQKALRQAFSASGGEDSIISQLLMAGIAGKDLAFEMAAGNTQIKNFVAGNADAAQKIRDLGDAVATGKISQDEFHKGMRAILPSVEQTGKEFAGLYGVSDIATTMTEAGSSVQKYNVQMEQLQKAEEEGLDGVTKSADGAGGAILGLQAQLIAATSSIKSGVNTGIADFIEAMGGGQQIKEKIDGTIAKFDTYADTISKSIGDIAVYLQDIGNTFKDFNSMFGIVAAAPWDFLMGGTSKNELQAQLTSKVEVMGLGEQISAEFIKGLSANDATQMIVGLGRGEEDGLKTMETIKARRIKEEKADLEEMKSNLIMPGKAFDEETNYAIPSQSQTSSSGTVAATDGSFDEENNYAIPKPSPESTLQTGYTGTVMPSVSLDGEAEVFAAPDIDATLIEPGTSNDDVKGYGSSSAIARLMTQWVNANDGFGTGLSYKTGAQNAGDELSHLIDANGGKLPGDLKSSVASIQSIFDANAIGNYGDMFDPSWSGKKKDLWWIRQIINNTVAENIGGEPVFRKYGGPVGMSDPHVVGERGPELWSPGYGAGGTVTPFEQLATAEHSESLLDAVKKLNVSMTTFNTTQLKANEMYASLTSEQISKLTTLVNNTRTGNKIASTMASNG